MILILDTYLAALPIKGSRERLNARPQEGDLGQTSDSEVVGPVNEKKGHLAKTRPEASNIPKKESWLTRGMNKLSAFGSGLGGRTGLKRANSMRDLSNPNKETDEVQKSFKSFTISHGSSKAPKRPKLANITEK